MAHLYKVAVQTKALHDGKKSHRYRDKDTLIHWPLDCG